LPNTYSKQLKYNTFHKNIITVVKEYSSPP